MGALIREVSMSCDVGGDVFPVDQGHSSSAGVRIQIRQRMVTEDDKRHRLARRCRFGLEHGAVEEARLLARHRAHGSRSFGLRQVEAAT